MKFTKKALVILTSIFLMLYSVSAFAETSTPPDMPAGQAPAAGGAPGGAPGGTPGGQSQQPESYTAVSAYDTDTTLTGETVDSTGTDENAILVTGGTVTVEDATVSRTSAESTGGDSSSFYGVGAALLVTSGTLKVTGSTITTNAGGGAGVFAYGDGTAYVADTSITTQMGTSGGIHVAGGGTLYASNLTVETSGASAAAIRSDRGGGTMVVDGGTYTANGTGSPALYCTADITVNDATLVATGSEALCLEGLNTVRLFNTNLSGNMPDNEQNDTTWTVILYQSMSGDSEIGEGRFEMDGGTLTSQNGGLFYTTNTESEFVVSNVTITPADNSDYFLRCTGNSNARGWGTAGANGADCTFTGITQTMVGNVIWDSISNLDMYLTSGSSLTGAVVDDETNAGNGGDGYCSLSIDSLSSWVVTGDSTVTSLYNEGSIVDESGAAVSVIGTDGTVYVQGTSAFTVTASQYSTQCDLSGAGTMSSWSDYAEAME